MKFAPKSNQPAGAQNGAPVDQKKLAIFHKYFPGVDPTRNIYSDSSDKGYDELANLSLETAMLNSVIGSLKKGLAKRRGKRMLDLCCGSGVLPKWFKGDAFFSAPDFRYVGVDINQPWLDKAAEIIGGDSRYALICADATNFSYSLKFDAIAVVSGYHHIPTQPNLKSDFLRSMRGLLKRSGIAVIYEKLIARFELGNADELFENSILFYYLRLKEMEKAGYQFTRGQIEASGRLAWQSSIGEDEYKVWHDYLVEDLQRCGLEIVSKEKIWPAENILEIVSQLPREDEMRRYFERDEKAGDYVFVVRRAE